MSAWLSILLQACMVLHLIAMGMCIHRLIVGPDAADRAIALDTLTIVFIGVVSILCIVWGSTLYFDAIWILTLVGFLGSAAIARYLDRGRIF